MARIVGLLVVAFVSLPATASGAAWLPPQPLGPTGGNVSNPALAAAPDGRVFATWVRREGTDLRIDVAARPPGGPWEQAQIASPAGNGGAGGPKLALDAAGNAILMWHRGGEIEWMTRAASEPAFTNVRSVPIPAGERPGQFSLAVTPSGTAGLLVATLEDIGDSDLRIRLRALTRPPGGDFGNSEVLIMGDDEDPVSFSIPTFRLVGAPDDHLYGTWSQFRSDPGGTETFVRAALRGAGASGFAVEDVAHGVTDSDPASNANVSNGVIGVDALGNVTVAYILSSLALSSEARHVELRTRAPGGPFAPPEPVTPVAADEGPVALAFAMNRAGASVFVWNRRGSLPGPIEACVRPVGSPCAPTEPLASIGFAPEAAMGDGGAAVAAWRGDGLDVAAAAYRAAGSSFSAPLPIEADSQVLLSGDGLAVDPLGHGLVATDRFMTADRRAELLVFDPVAPQIRSIGAPAAGLPGRPLAFSGDVFDVWGPVTSTWSFGDGGSAAGPSAAHTFANAGDFTPSLTATDAAGNRSSRSVAVAIGDRRAPVIRSFRMSRRVFAVGLKRTPLSAQRRRRVATGTTFRFSVSEASRALIRIERPARGFLRGRRCVKRPPRAGPRRRCTRYVRAGALRRDAHAGRNRVAFSGRLGRRALKAGRHRARLSATDAAGNRSRARTLSFRVVRSR